MATDLSQSYGTRPVTVRLFHTFACSLIMLGSLIMLSSQINDSLIILLGCRKKGMKTMAIYSDETKLFNTEIDQSLHETNACQTEQHPHS